MPTLLLISIFLPLLGAAAVGAAAPLGRQGVRWTALGFTVATLAIVLVLVAQYQRSGPHDGPFATTEIGWLFDTGYDVDDRYRKDIQDTSLPDIRFHVSLDGISLWLFGLSAVLMLTSVLVSWQAIDHHEPLFYSMLLLLEFGCLGVFTAQDIILFYVFFEFTLIPLFFLIGIWGSEQRRYAAVKFFLFTLAGSLLTFLGLLTIVFWANGRLGLAGRLSNDQPERLTFSIPELTQRMRTHDRLFAPATDPNDPPTDLNQDGRLNVKEVTAPVHGKQRTQANRAFRNFIFARLDTDNSGRVSLAELQADANQPDEFYTDSLFRLTDNITPDGVVSYDELLPRIGHLKEEELDGLFLLLEERHQELLENSDNLRSGGNAAPDGTVSVLDQGGNQPESTRASASNDEGSATDEETTDLEKLRARFTKLTITSRVFEAVPASRWSELTGWEIDREDFGRVPLWMIGLQGGWEISREEVEEADAPIGLFVFLALFVGFAIKVPLFPLHTWLPLAHVQAPTAGSVFLAGILLKIGTYGFLRFNIAMLPEATAVFAPWLLGLAVAGIIYGALVALAQSDMKKLIAYSSVSHLGFCMLGLFALNQLGAQGAVLQMVNHGISTGALFALVGMLYERYHSRQIGDYGGLARKLPVMAFFVVFFTMSSIGLPGMNGFAGEILILIGMFQRAWTDAPLMLTTELRWFSILALLGVVLGAWYMLWLVQRVFFGPLKEPHHDDNGDHPPIRDLNAREIAALAPLAVLVLWIGLWPGYFLKPIAGPLKSPIAATQAPLQEAYSGDLEEESTPEPLKPQLATKP